MAMEQFGARRAPAPSTDATPSATQAVKFAVHPGGQRCTMHLTRRPHGHQEMPLVPGNELDVVADRLSAVRCDGCGEAFDVQGLEPFNAVTCPHCGHPQPVPVRFGSFLLTHLLGRGGMGAVYRGWDDSLERYVAVKVMRREYCEDGRFLEGFRREARAAAALNHAHVVQVYLFGEHRRQLYLVMELVDGGSLDDWVQGSDLIAEIRLLTVATEAAKGLWAAQEAGLVHGDIKPANILFARNGTAKLADFGLASFVYQQPYPSRQVWGTAYYIPPERIQRKPGDHRADIYSLGAALFHAATGRPPFTGATPRDVAAARLQNPPLDPREFRPALTSATAAVLQRMMAVHPARRYPTYASLLADLRKARDAAEQAAAERQPEADLAASAPRGRHWWVVASLFLAGLGALAIILVWHANQQRSEHAADFAYYALDPATGSQRAVTQQEAAVRARRRQQEQAAQTDQGIFRAVRILAEGNAIRADLALRSLAEDLSPGDPARARVGLARLLCAWIAGSSDALGKEELEHVRAQLTSLEADPSAPVVKDTVDYLAGQVDAGGYRRCSEGWPAAYRPFAGFVIGLQAMGEGRFGDALAPLRSYAGADGPADIWSGAFAGLANRWIQQVEGWADVRNNVDAEDPRAAVQALTPLRDDADPLLQAAIDADLRHWGALAEQSARQRREAAREQTRALAKKETGRLDELWERIRPALKRKEFTHARATLHDKIGGVQSKQGKAAATLAVQRLECMMRLHRFLMQQLNGRPPRQRIASVGGRIARADEAGITVASVDGGAATPWRRIPDRLYFRLIEFYLKSPTMDSRKRADLLLCLAVASDTIGSADASDAALAAAVRADPELIELARRLLPDRPAPRGPGT